MRREKRKDRGCAVRDVLICGLRLMCLIAFMSASAFGQTTEVAPAHGHPPQHAAAATFDEQVRAHPLSRDSLLASKELNIIPIPDIVMRDQDNRRVSLYKDLMKDKLVVLNFFYTTCKGICPTAGAWFSRLQDTLGQRLGKDVSLISISLDPEVDTPPRLKQWAVRWKQRPGWSLLTSKSPDALALIKRFQGSGAVGMHSPIVFVGEGSGTAINWAGVDIGDFGDALWGFFCAENADRRH